MSLISDNLQAVHVAICKAERAYQRPSGSVQLMAVSKTFPVESVLEAAQAGQRCFGENYVQEGSEKVDWFRQHHPELTLEWHFIGPLQSNKTRPVAERFAWVHSIERLKIAQRLSEQRPAGLADLNICLQVNISGEASKSGVTPDQLPALAQQVSALPRLKLRGLMAVPEATDEVSRQRQAFAQLKQCFDELCRHGHALDTLSMGMSADMDAAIAEGSSMVRIGTAIFGSRQYAK